MRGPSGNLKHSKPTELLGCSLVILKSPPGELLPLANSETDVADDFAAEALFEFSQDVDLGNLLEFVALLALTFLSLLTMDIFSM
jgi:hypothetical protein